MRLWLAIVKDTDERAITRPGRMGGQAMVIEDAILEKLRRLPPAKQEEVLHFVEDLEQATVPPRRSLEGYFAHLGVEITSEDIAEARREMWGNFPRDDV